MLITPLANPSLPFLLLQITTFRNRNLRLPEDADAAAIQEAIYEDGVVGGWMPVIWVGGAGACQWVNAIKEATYAGG